MKSKNSYTMMRRALKDIPIKSKDASFNATLVRNILDEDNIDYCLSRVKILSQVHPIGDFEISEMLLLLTLVKVIKDEAAKT